MQTAAESPEYEAVNVTLPNWQARDRIAIFKIGVATQSLSIILLIEVAKGLWC